MAEPGYCDHGTPGGDIGGCRLCKNAAREKHVHNTLNGFLKKHPDYFMSWIETQTTN